MATDFEACLAESGTVAFRVAFRLLRSREDAEDVSQEAVVRAMQRFDSLRDRHRFRAWLVRMAWRLAIDRRRSDSRRAGRDAHLVPTGIVEADAERDLIARERAAHLQAAVDRLPAKLRTPFVMGHVEGRSLDEVAALLELPAGTVKSRSFQARQRLRRSLVKSGVVLALCAWAAVMVQRRPLVSVDHAPAVAPTGRLAPALVILRAPGDTGARAGGPITVAAAVPSALPLKIVVTVPTIEIPVVRIPVVKVRVVHVPVVETVTTSIHSMDMEKQR
jgi:RNA polymerase sigma-70 factor (ECF subfamily)